MNSSQKGACFREGKYLPKSIILQIPRKKNHYPHQERVLPSPAKSDDIYGTYMQTLNFRHNWVTEGERKESS